MDRQMAASLDHWLTTPPDGGDIPGVDFLYRCSNACGAFLPINLDSIGYESCLYRCPGMPNEHGWDIECDKWREKEHGPHWFFDHKFIILFRICRKCGYRNTEVVI